MNDLRPLVITLREPEWDLTACDELEKHLAPAFSHPNVVIDMSAVTFIDSSCLRTLALMRQKRVTEGGFGPVRLVIEDSNIRRLFSVVGFDKLWPIFETLKEALDAANAVSALA
jgi:anti-anti-sigma factor